MSLEQRQAELNEMGVDDELALMLEEARPPREPVSPELFDALEADINDERGPISSLRERPTWQRIGLAMLLLVLLAVGTVLITPRVDLHIYPAVRMWLGIGLFGGAALLTTLVSLRPIYRPALPRWAGVTILVVAAVLIPFGLAMMPPAHAAHPASVGALGAEFIPRALGCFLFGLGLASPVVGLIWLLDRQGHRPRVRALLAAAAGGLLGNLALQLHCPIVHQSHLLAGHALSAVATVVLYFLIRSWLDRRA